MTELKTLLEDLKAEKNAIQEQTLPLRAERDRLLASIQPVLDKIRALEQKYISIERPRLAELDNQIGKISVMLGGRKMSDAATATTGV